MSDHCNTAGMPAPLGVLVLGPSAVRLGGAPISVERPLERALLVRLALADGLPVPPCCCRADARGRPRRRPPRRTGGCSHRARAVARPVEAGRELEALAAENPLHERLWCLLALALYRTGRQADALSRMAKLRSRLADELGVDPAPDTAAMELRLLRQDATLLPPAPSPAAKPRAVRRAPALTVLVTSQRPLQLEAEEVRPMQPLDALAAARLFTEHCAADAQGTDPEQVGGIRRPGTRAWSPRWTGVTSCSATPNAPYCVEWPFAARRSRPGPDGAAVRAPAVRVHRRARHALRVRRPTGEGSRGSNPAGHRLRLAAPPSA